MPTRSQLIEISLTAANFLNDIHGVIQHLRSLGRQALTRAGELNRGADAQYAEAEENIQLANGLLSYFTDAQQYHRDNAAQLRTMMTEVGNIHREGRSYDSQENEIELNITIGDLAPSTWLEQLSQQRDRWVALVTPPEVNANEPSSPINSM